MKMLLVSLFFVFSIMFVVPSYALNLENKVLVSDDESLIIEFGKNTVRYLLRETITAPNLEFGIIRLVDQDILLEGAFDDVSVSVLGDSIAITSFDVPVIIYARNIGDNNYFINLYTVENGGFKKQTFTAILESITAETTPTKEKVETSTIVESEEINQDIIIAVSSPIRTQVRDVYILTIRVYDQTINPTADIQKQEGYLEGIEVNIEILDPLGNVFKKISGETDNKGYFIFKHKIIENIDRTGKYTLTITAINQVYEGSTNFIERITDVY